MSLIPYDPFNPSRRDYASLPFLMRFLDDGWFDNTLRVRVDVRETASEVIVSAEIPGLEKKEDVQIVVHENHLHLNGRIDRIRSDAAENVHHTERFYGQFSRTVSLPSSVDESRANASYRNGVLEVRIPKSEKAIGRQVDVEFH